jgi:sortase A
MKKRFKVGGIIISLALCALWQYDQSNGIQAWFVDILLRAAWTRTKASGHPVKPWPGACTWPIARLSIPHLNIERIVLSQAGNGLSIFALGHSDSSVFPGDLGNSVLNIYYRDIFETFLKRLKIGNTLVLESLRHGRWHYQIADVKIVKKTKTYWVEPSLNRRLTLISCYPCLNVEEDLRYVVVAEEVVVAEKKDKEGNHKGLPLP